MLELLIRYSHGLAVVPLVDALRRRGALDRLAEPDGFTPSGLAEELGANPGPFEVALGALRTLGWIAPTEGGLLRTGPELARAREIPDDVLDLYAFPFDEYLDGGAGLSLAPWIDRSEARWGTDDPLLADLLDGVLAVPLLLALEGRSGADDGRGLDLLDRIPAPGGGEVARLFALRGWTEAGESGPALTPAGRFLSDRVGITAVVASYRPMFLRSEELLFGDPASVFALDPEGRETHVDRTANVLGSGFQHVRYFEALADRVDEVLAGAGPHGGPRWVADTGAGDGTLLRRVCDRGDGPRPVPIAVDFHREALELARRALADLDPIAVQGDVADPAAIVRDLATHGVDDPGRVLHVRSFLDHDRSYRSPEDRGAAADRARMPYTGVYVGPGGESLPPGEVVQSTVEHLRRWAGVVNEHGLVVLEVHCLPADLAGRYLDVCESLHFDACQSLSRQYLLEPEVFLLAAAEAGLFPRPGGTRAFPEHLPFTRVTLHHFDARPWRVRTAAHGDRPAVEALEELWPRPGAGPTAGTASDVAARVEDFPEGQLVLCSDGGVEAAVVVGRGDGVEGSPPVVRIDSLRLRPGGDPAYARELLRTVELYWCLSGRAPEVVGLASARAALGGEEGRDGGRGRPGGLGAVAAAVANAVREAGFAPSDDPREGERAVGLAALRGAVATLQRMGAPLAEGEGVDAGDVERRLGIVPRYRRYLGALLARLGDLGLLRRDGDRWVATGAVADFAPNDPGSEIAALEGELPERHPGAAALARLAARGLRRYEEVLTGRVDAAEVLFRGGDLDAFGALFGGDPVSTHFHRVVGRAVRETAERLPGDRPLRVLEVGGGTAGTTVGMLAEIEPVRESVELCFTDVSRAFLRRAERLLAGRHPGVETALLDLEIDPAAQGFGDLRFDVVVAGNVLHDTRDVVATLGRLATLLEPGGLLAIDEYTAPKDALLLSGALLHGPWLFEDGERRLPGSWLLSVPLWIRAIEEAGYEMLAAFALPTEPCLAGCGQSVMLCRAPAAARVDQPAAAEAASAAEGGAVAAGLAASAGDGSGGVVARGFEADLATVLGPERAAVYSPSRPVMEMGLDSIELVELAYLLGKRFDLDLTSTFFFRHATPERIVRALRERVPAERLAELSEAVEAPAPGVHPAGRAGAADPLAVVGVACRLPGGVESLDDLADFLARGGDAIRPLPENRWRWPAGTDPEGARRGIDRGGFLERIDEFDAGFFRISPREARSMDPQQRLLLELAWAAFEDAGHRPSDLSGRPVGVFVGVCQGDYRDLLVAAPGAVDGYVGPGGAFSIQANRLSYFFDFTGPSLVVDTACSSSLVALHHAAEAIRRGECEQALVGAANLLCSPTMSLAYYEAGMLSPSGRCRVFDRDADGYVRGEGAAMVLVKPLASALADGDSIYGLVRGTAVNHGGQAASLTAPRPDAQAAVVTEAWRRAGLPASTAGMIEAHGTGTPLGDPIEVAGLTDAFRSLYADEGAEWPGRSSCGIGSIKSNVGHLEGAAGMAGLLKALAAIDRGRLPRTLHYERRNPEVRVDGTPFYVVDREVDWPRFRGAEGEELPRRAGVSSFGFGGANAHAVVEEHRPAAPDRDAEGAAGPWLIVLSARDGEGLRARARALLDRLGGAAEARNGSGGERARAALDRVLARFGWDAAAGDGDLEWDDLGWGASEAGAFLAAVDEELGVSLPPRALLDHPSLGALADRIAAVAGSSGGKDDHGGTEELPLADLAYTLQAGREAMTERLAFVARDRRELAGRLRAAADGIAGASGVHRGVVAAGRVAGGSAEETERAEASLLGRDLEALAGLWVDGAEIDLRRLHREGARRRLHLPTYPFARERHWVEEGAEAPAAVVGGAAHPLLGAAPPEVSSWRFETTFTGDEPFLADHRVRGRSILPAVAYLELVRAAVERVDPGVGRALAAVAWLRPLEAGPGPRECSVRISRAGNGELACEVHSRAAGGGDELFHAQCRALPAASGGASEEVDLDAVRARCPERHAGDETYRELATLGFDYGRAHQAIAAVHVGSGEALAELSWPGEAAGQLAGWALHPSLADGALQAALAVSSGQSPEERPAIPFELEEAWIGGECTAKMWAWARRREEAEGAAAGRFDVDLCDDRGRVRARFRGLALLAGAGAASAPEPTEALLVPRWEPVAVPESAPGSGAPASGVVVLGEVSVLHRVPDGVRFVELDPDGGERSPERAVDEIGALGEAEHLVWIVPEDPPGGDRAVRAAQRRQARLGLRLFRALAAVGATARPLAWTVVTTGVHGVAAGEAGNPTHAGLQGLLGSIAEEVTGWTVRLVDLPAGEPWPWDEAVAGGPAEERLAAHRSGTWYRRVLEELEVAEDGAPAPSPYREDGAYVVIGGAGGLGAAWTEALLSRHRARVAWIGRRPEDAAIRERLDRLAKLGPRPLYLSADAADPEALAEARDAVLGELGRIDGVVVSTVVLRDRSAYDLTADDLDAVLASKVDAGLAVAEVFARDRELDFLLFFSSIATLVTWPGQAAYAAGCAFVDALARRLDAERPFPVRTVDWGYWGDFGLAATEEHRQRMAERGLATIEMPRAMEVLDRLLAGSRPRLAYLRSTRRDPRSVLAIGRRSAHGAAAEEAGARPAPPLETLMAMPRGEALGDLLADLRLRVATVLEIDPARLDAPSRPFPASNLGEFGMDSLSSNSLRNLLRRDLGVDLAVSRIVGEEVGHLVEAIYELLLLRHVGSGAGRDEAHEDTETFVL
jgi:acyl transferase domain-containing protein/acyl carrier protein